MNADQTIAIVRRHNAWRRGDSSEMLPPAIIGLALDALCDEVERLEREVAAERALADEMAGQLEHASLAYDPGGCQKMFEAWKAARQP